MKLDLARWSATSKLRPLWGSNSCSLEASNHSSSGSPCFALLAASRRATTCVRVPECGTSSVPASAASSSSSCEATRSESSWKYM